VVLIAKCEKFLISDIDGTLAYRDVIPERVESACLKLKGDGWTLMVATGRILASALQHIRKIKASVPAIVYDGARIMDFERGMLFWEKKIDCGLVKDVLLAGWDFGGGIQVMGDEKVFCRPHEEVVIDYFKSIGVEVEPNLTQPKELNSVYRVIFHGDEGLIKELYDHISGKFKDRTSITMAGEKFLDVLPPGVSKGHALSKILKTKDSSNKIVVAVGDHMNDETLLLKAHIAFAMQDAPDALKKQADVVLPPAENGGFAEIVKYLEDEEFLFSVLSKKGLNIGECKDI